jgi:hypothetical protein
MMRLSDIEESLTAQEFLKPERPTAYVYVDEISLKQADT